MRFQDLLLSCLDFQTVELPSRAQPDEIQKRTRASTEVAIVIFSTLITTFRQRAHQVVIREAKSNSAAPLQCEPGGFLPT